MFKKLFQRKPEPAAEAVPLKDGFSVIPSPIRKGSSFRIAGTIKHETESGETQVRDFIRADSYESIETAQQATVAKAEQIIREQGQRMFESDPSRPL